MVNMINLNNKNMTNLKLIAETFQKAGKLKEYKEIIDLMDNSVEDKGRIEELNEKNICLEKENRKLSEKLEFKEDIEFRDNAYRKKSGGDERYCSGCWNKNKEQIVMHLTTYGCAICPVCKTEIIISGKNEVIDNDNKESFDPHKIF